MAVTFVTWVLFAHQSNPRIMQKRFYSIIICCLFCLFGTAQTLTISPGDITICAGEPVAFSYSQTGLVEPISCFWDLGDGNTSMNCNPVHTFPSPGINYYVCVEVIDANNTELQACMTISVPMEISFVLQGTDVSCTGEFDGSIECFPSNAMEFYSYTWSNGMSSQNATGLSPGTYTVTLTDVNGCTASDSYTVMGPNPIGLTLDVTHPMNCAATDGAIDLTVSGGVAPYTYNWDVDGNGNLDTEDIEGFWPGYYEVTVTDANGCTATIGSELVGANVLFITANVTDASNCIAPDGAIDITATGGVGGYAYIWSNGESTEDITALYPGTYTVTVSDIDGCETMATHVVGASDGPQPTSIETSPASCGLEDGSVTVSIPNEDNYTFDWSHGAVGSTINNMGAGTYVVTITDITAIDCHLNVLEVEVEETNNLSLNITVLNSTCGNADGVAIGSVIGGSGSYTYNWNGLTSTSMITGLPSGTYQVTATDNVTGCQVIGSFTIMDEISYATTILINNSPIVVSCVDAMDGFVDYSFSPTTGNVEIIDANTDEVQTNGSLGVGAYCIRATDVNGCITGLECFQIAAPSPMIVDIQVIPGDCGPPIQYGSIQSTVSGGAAPYTYLWSDGATTQNINNVIPGLYSLIVTDDNGCETIVENIEVLSPTLASGTITFNNLPTGTTCTGGSDGFVDFTYSPTVGVTVEIQDLNGNVYTNGSLPGGEYCVVATTADGCIFQDCFEILQPFPILLTSDSPDKFCPGETVTLALNETFISYDWSTFENTATVDIGTPGDYTVTVTDQDGCTGVYEFLDIQQANDCVWPGDANYDGIADNTDILFLGLNYGDTGDIRPNASNDWVGQLAEFEWPDFTNGQNNKHSDCDGDGIISHDDTLAIVQNYGLPPHQLREMETAGGGIPITLSFDASTANYGEYVGMEVTLGDLIDPVPEAYGIAFSIQFNYPEVINPNTISVDFSNSAFGPDNETITLFKPLLDVGRMDFAITRFDHVGLENLMGEVVRLSFIIEDNIDGFAPSTNYVLEANIVDVTCVASNGFYHPTTSFGTEMTMLPTNSNHNPVQVNQGVDYFPNPVTDELNLVMQNGTTIKQVRAFDAVGRLVHTQMDDVSIISTEHWTKGIYFIEVTDTEEQLYVLKVMKE